ncbi:MAG: hypothetical protein EA385_07195 [Salinarimonadaceae bacterium]|nr:MAG: hypothetical protein EA385_07195 [Salinarimonadaceae bacterium]
MSIDATAGMNASWSAMRADARSEAVRYATDSSQIQADRNVAASAERAPEPAREAAPPPGQGRFVDTRA